MADAKEGTGRTWTPDPINLRYSEDQTGQYDDTVVCFIRVGRGTELIASLSTDEQKIAFVDGLIEATNDLKQNRRPRYFGTDGKLKPRDFTAEEVAQMLAEAREAAVAAAE